MPPPFLRTLHLLLAFSKRLPPAWLFWERDNPRIVLTLTHSGTMTGLPGCLDQLSTHAAAFYTVGRTIARSHFLHRPHRTSPIERKVVDPKTPDSASNFRRVTFTMPSAVRYPTACMFVSPLRLALSPRVRTCHFRRPDSSGFPSRDFVTARRSHSPVAGSVTPAVRLRA